MSWVEIDGSIGEGGGQVLRTSLSLATVTGKQARISNIRAGRRKPGLMRQHLTAVRAIAEVCNAKVSDIAIGTKQIDFVPGAVKAGSYSFSVGTAGSACLVLQTVLPPLLLANGPSSITIEGGTHNPLAPPFDFLRDTFFPQLARMGARIDANLDRPGFYPAGGGKLTVRLEPVEKLSPIDLADRGNLQSLGATLMHANLPEEIAKEEVALLRRELGLPESTCRIELVRENPGPGNVILVRAAFDNLTEVFTGFGQKGVPARRVVGELAKEVQSYLASDAPAGVYLTDQMILPMAMAGAGTLRTVGLSAHATTNMEVVSRFLPVAFTTDRIGRSNTVLQVTSSERRRGHRLSVG
jgi:RNA 3'-terminal phosphate cyclase (ATP)